MTLNLSQPNFNSLTKSFIGLARDAHIGKSIMTKNDIVVSEIHEIVEIEQNDVFQYFGVGNGQYSALSVSQGNLLVDIRDRSIYHENGFIGPLVAGESFMALKCNNISGSNVWTTKYFDCEYYGMIGRESLITVKYTGNGQIISLPHILIGNKWTPIVIRRVPIIHSTQHKVLREYIEECGKSIIECSDENVNNINNNSNIEIAEEKATTSSFDGYHQFTKSPLKKHKKKISNQKTNSKFNPLALNGYWNRIDDDSKETELKSLPFCEKYNIQLQQPINFCNCKCQTQIKAQEPISIGNQFELTFDKIKTKYCIKYYNKNKNDFPCQLGIKVNDIFIVPFFVFHTTEPVDFRLSAGKKMCWKFGELRGLRLRAAQSPNKKCINNNNLDGYYFEGQTKNKLDACIVFWRDTTFQFYFDPAQIDKSQITSIELVCGDGSTQNNEVSIPIFPEPSANEKAYVNPTSNNDNVNSNSIRNDIGNGYEHVRGMGPMIPKLKESIPYPTGTTSSTTQIPDNINKNGNDEWKQTVPIQYTRQRKLDTVLKNDIDLYWTKQLVFEMKLYVNEYKKHISNNTFEKYWTRKSQQNVFAILMIHPNPNSNNKPLFFRGRNNEISLPCGSICAERSAISTAISQIINLKRKQFYAIAVIDPDWKNIGIKPCGVCQENIKKIQEESTKFKIITFPKKNHFNVINEHYSSNYTDKLFKNNNIQ